METNATGSAYLVSWIRLEIHEYIRNLARTIVTASLKTNIQLKLMAIIGLNMLDGLLTYIGIEQGYSVEVNPITKIFIGDFTSMMLLKIVWPTLLIMLAFVTMERLDIKKPGFVKSCVNGAFGVYLFISLNHIYVLYQFFQYMRLV